MSRAVLEGAVLWFDNVEGFGCVQAPNGDMCFVPWDALERAGMSELEPRTRVVMQVERSTVIDLQLARSDLRPWRSA
jgi:cold shock CspA family protein